MCVFFNFMSEFGQKLSKITLRATPFLMSSLLALTACEANGGSNTNSTPSRFTAASTPFPTPTLFPLTTNFSEQTYQRLNQERNRLIAYPLQKPTGIVPFSQNSEPINIEGTNVRVSLNALPSGLEIYYSPTGIRQLYQDLGLNSVPSVQFHLYTGEFRGNPADTEWQEGNCKAHAPIQYMNLLTNYVLNHFPINEWDRRQDEITLEWNNRIAAVARHEGKHGSSHFKLDGCKQIGSIPSLQAEIEAMEEEFKGRGKPLSFWLQLKKGESFRTNTLVQTFWQER